MDVGEDEFLESLADVDVHRELATGDFKHEISSAICAAVALSGWVKVAYVSTGGDEGNACDYGRIFSRA